MKFTSETKFFLGIIAATLAIIGAAVIIFSQSSSPASAIPKAEIIGNASYSKGNASAAVYLVEFSDFQCPSCKLVKPIVDEVVETNKDKLLFVYRHFPLDQHQFAIKAALAAEAAGKQGKFWEMYDLLFANQEQFTDEIFLTLAKQLNLNEEVFSQDMKDPNLHDTILTDRKFGLSIGINSTPTFFLNGNKLNLRSYNDIKTEVERAL